MAKDYFTSDLHFYHKNILKFCDRPVGDLTNEQWLYNELMKIPVGSTLWHLGDLSWSRDKLYEILKFMMVDMNLEVNLIVGNHDNAQEIKKAIIKVLDDYPTARPPRVRDYYEISSGHLRSALGDDYKERLGITADKVVLFHFPIHEWNSCHRGSLHFHGHCHGNLEGKQMKNRIDVGIDSLGKVMSLEEVIIELVKRNECAIMEPTHH